MLLSGGRVRRQAQLPLVAKRFSWWVEAGGPRNPCPPFPTVEAIPCRYRKAAVSQGQGIGGDPSPRPRERVLTSQTWKRVLVSPVLPKLCTGLRIPERGAGPLRVMLTLFWRHPGYSPELPTRLSLPPTPQGRPGGTHGGGAAGAAELSPALAAVQVTPRCAVLARAAGGRVASRRTPVEAAAQEERLRGRNSPPTRGGSGEQGPVRCPAEPPPTSGFSSRRLGLRARPLSLVGCCSETLTFLHPGGG